MLQNCRSAPNLKCPLKITDEFLPTFIVPWDVGGAISVTETTVLGVHDTETNFMKN